MLQKRSTQVALAASVPIALIVCWWLYKQKTNKNKSSSNLTTSSNITPITTEKLTKNKGDHTDPEMVKFEHVIPCVKQTADMELSVAPLNAKENAKDEDKSEESVKENTEVIEQKDISNVPAAITLLEEEIHENDVINVEKGSCENKVEDCEANSRVQNIDVVESTPVVLNSSLPNPEDIKTVTNNAENAHKHSHCDIVEDNLVEEKSNDLNLTEIPNNCESRNIVDNTDENSLCATNKTSQHSLENNNVVAEPITNKNEVSISTSHDADLTKAESTDNTASSQEPVSKIPVNGPVLIASATTTESSSLPSKDNIDDLHIEEELADSTVSTVEEEQTVFSENESSSSSSTSHDPNSNMNNNNEERKVKESLQTLVQEKKEIPISLQNGTTKHESNHIENSKVVDPEDEIIHVYIEFPSELVGLLIGRQGKNIKLLKEKSKADVTVRSIMYTDEIQILDIHGDRAAIDKAIGIIERRFPNVQLIEPETMPAFTSPLHTPPGSLTCPIASPPPFSYPVPEMSQLSLPEGLQVEVVVSAISDCDNIFVQQYTHPTYYALSNLEQAMFQCYNNQTSIPSLLTPVQIGLICVVQQDDTWFRAQIMQSDEEKELVMIKFVDYGGFANVPSSMVKQIRADFISLPFQAVSCFLDSIAPREGQSSYNEEGIHVLQDLLKEGSFQVAVTNYTAEGDPLVNLYKTGLDKRVYLVNDLLVKKGVARSTLNSDNYVNNNASSNGLASDCTSASSNTESSLGAE